MSRWWRAYDEAVDDPKLCLLTDRQFRAWFNICCITSQSGGMLPSMAAVAFKLRTTVDKAKAIVAELVVLGLIDLDNETGEARPHNWEGRQFQSDVSTERVKRFRQQQRNVSSAVSETPPEAEAEAEAENRTDSEKKESCAVAVATRPARNEEFEEFWKAYPKRDGANPKEPARKLFVAAIKAGATSSEIIAGARACAARDRDKIGTPYIPQAVKWLRDRRWQDYAAEPATGPPKPPDPSLPSHEDLLRRYSNGHPDSPRESGQILEGSRGFSIEPEGRKAGHDQAWDGGMGGVGTIFSRASGFRSIGDAAGDFQSGPGEGRDDADPMA